LLTAINDFDADNGAFLLFLVLAFDERKDAVVYFRDRQKLQTDLSTS